MSKKPAGKTEPEEPETPVDRFEHEIEELEHPLGRSGARQWIVGVVVAAGLVGAFFLGSIAQKKKTDPSHSAIATIETLEPRRTTLAEKPLRFQWESISGADRYTVTIQEEGQTMDLIVRQVSTNSMELTPQEAGRLARGGRYSWKVRARSRDGWTVGEGESGFYL